MRSRLLHFSPSLVEPTVLALRALVIRSLERGVGFLLRRGLFRSTLSSATARDPTEVDDPRPQLGGPTDTLGGTEEPQ